MSTNRINGVLPPNHAFHETLEITHGSRLVRNRILRFSSIQPGEDGMGWRSYPAAPPSSGRMALADRVSLRRSSAISAAPSQKTRGAGNPPIIEAMGRWYLALNPAFEKSVRGLNSSTGFDLLPAARLV